MESDLLAGYTLLQKLSGCLLDQIPPEAAEPMALPTPAAVVYNAVPVAISIQQY